ncbi:hypothetical protein FNT36_07400 [Hymenobacter setariae]|uniref:DUF4177 domain-containing protein n=1 Tax=Hymenobacter setariae TaxID=2594794 RepID=A0A558BXN4_9BACT|nr:hypothetical protein [Hymenobacter setariae]TVT41274.1 hypothetical protein FNT36_07400 [Hymenobacter setariae]
MAFPIRNWCLGALLLLVSLSALAQTGRPTYDFMTISVIKSPYRNDCYLLLTPTFQGKSEIKLEEEYNLASDRYRANLQRNITLLNNTLGELSAAGWDLVDVHSTEVGAEPAGLQPTATLTRYLLRKAKN